MTNIHFGPLTPEMPMASLSGLLVNEVEKRHSIPCRLIYGYQSPSFPISWEDMFMDVSNFHLDVKSVGMHSKPKGGQQIGLVDDITVDPICCLHYLGN